MSGLRSLESPRLGRTAVSDLSLLSGLSGLKELSLFDCGGVRDLSPLSGLVSLESLSLT